MEWYRTMFVYVIKQHSKLQVPLPPPLYSLFCFQELQRRLQSPVSLHSTPLRLESLSPPHPITHVILCIQGKDDPPLPITKNTRGSKKKYASQPRGKGEEETIKKASWSDQRTIAKGIAGEGVVSLIRRKRKRAQKCIAKRKREGIFDKARPKQNRLPCPQPNAMQCCRKARTLSGRATKSRSDMSTWLWDSRGRETSCRMSHATRGLKIC